MDEFSVPGLGVPSRDLSSRRSGFAVTEGSTAVTMVDTAEPPRLKSNLPSNSSGYTFLA